MSVIFYMGATIAALTAALFLAVRAYFGKRKEVAEKEAVIDAQKYAIAQRDKYLEKLEAIQNDTEKKKESIHTGDPATDFDNSVSVLHDLAGNKKPPA